MTQRPCVGFTGYYGMRNFGDDLFGVLCAAAARRYWNADPLLVGPTLEGAQARATWPSTFPSTLYGSAGALGKAARVVGFVRGLRASDVLVMGGGSVITARESFRKPMMLSARRRGRVQLAAVGVSVGPFPDAASQEAAAAFVREFSYLSVRDRRSYELCRRMGLDHITHHGRDLAGLLRTVLPLSSRTVASDDRSVPRIGIAPCRYTVRDDHSAPTPAQWHDGIVHAITRTAAHTPLQVEVFSLNAHPVHGDEAMAAQLQARLRERGVAAGLHAYAGSEPLATVDAIQRCDAFVSARLHGAIVAYLCAVPFAIVDYHPKCRDFADDIGLPLHLRITSGAHETPAFMQVLDALLNDEGARARLSPSLYAQQAQDIFQCAPWSTSPAHTHASSTAA
ncbi:polysaccharide pyruvyl transferase family protein [Lysobacter sp. FW306-1B-D06B]|uniref:polysaccharide pyruvyl transferase family protein n=1 Tax=Lysobacter sp. FW306-1B-D06B TaxID=3140250 RepID=UPI003140BDDE